LRSSSRCSSSSSASAAGAEDDLLQAILDEWPSYFAYFVSFTVGAFWLRHQALTDAISTVDGTFVRR
jgi:uncharacterized membrane protein